MKKNPKKSISIRSTAIPLFYSRLHGRDKQQFPSLTRFPLQITIFSDFVKNKKKTSTFFISISFDLSLSHSDSLSISRFLTMILSKSLGALTIAFPHHCTAKSTKNKYSIIQYANPSISPDPRFIMF